MLNAEDGDTVTIMLFHDAVHLASEGVAKLIVPVGPPQRFEEVLNHENAKIIVCKPCADARNISESSCEQEVAVGGMNDFHAASKQPDTRVVCY